MTQTIKRKRNWFQFVSIAMFAVIVTGLLAFNVQSTALLRREAKNHDRLSLVLASEEKKVAELDLLGRRQKTFEAEFVMLERGLRNLYSEKCRTRDTFIPVFEDQLVSVRANLSTRGVWWDRKTATEFKPVSNTIFHVPPTGKHSLRIRAIRATIADALKGKLNKKKSTSSSIPPFDQSFELANGKVYETLIRTSKSKIKITLSDHEDIVLDFPFGNIANYPSGVSLGIFDRTVACPNQYHLPSELGGNAHAASIATYGIMRDEGRPNFNREGVVIQLKVESEGPLTSLPDDIYVVRRLLERFEAGIDTEFKLNEKGWYEFPYH